MSRRDPDRAGSLRLAATFLRIGVMNEAQYRANFFIQLVQSLLSVGTGLLVLALVFSHTAELDGWDRPQLLAVMGVFTLVGGVIRAVIQPNMQRLVEEIGEGKLDFALTKPADAQVLVSVRDIRLWQVADVLVGFVVLIVGLAQMRSNVAATDLFAFAGVLLVGLISIYCFWLILATVAFWLVRVTEVQELFDGLYRAGQYPVGIYPPWLRYGLTFVVPLAFAVTVPAEAATGRLSGTAAIVAVATTAALVIFSRWLWRRGLRRYAGASA